MQIENESRFKKDLYDTGFGHALNTQFDAGKEAGLKEMVLKHEQTMEGGEMEFGADVKIGKSRVFFNGYKGTLYKGLYLDKSVDGVDLRALADRIKNPPDENMVNATNRQDFEQLRNQHILDIGIDMEKIRAKEPETFLAMMARYQPPGLNVDGTTLDAVTAYALQNFRGRWFNADEKVTIQEADRMLMDTDSPRAVRKPLQVAKGVDELLTEWENGNPKTPRVVVQEQWDATERRNFKRDVAVSSLTEAETKKEFDRNTLKRFKPFMEARIEKSEGPGLDFYKIVPTWLVIDFGGPRTSYGNLALIRIPDEQNYLKTRFADYMFPELQKGTKLNDVIKALSQGKQETLVTHSSQHPKILVTANPGRETITIKDAVYGRFLSHDQFRTPAAKERITVEQQQRSNTDRNNNSNNRQSTSTTTGNEKKNKSDTVVGKPSQKGTVPAKLKQKTTSRKFAPVSDNKKGNRIK